MILILIVMLCLLIGIPYTLRVRETPLANKLIDSKKDGIIVYNNKQYSSLQELQKLTLSIHKQLGMTKYGAKEFATKLYKL